RSSDLLERLQTRLHTQRSGFIRGQHVSVPNNSDNSQPTTGLLLQNKSQSNAPIGWFKDEGSPSRTTFTVPFSGLWQFNVTFDMSGWAQDQLWSFWVVHNGLPARVASDRFPTASGTSPGDIVRSFPAVKGDVLHFGFTKSATGV